MLQSLVHYSSFLRSLVALTGTAMGTLTGTASRTSRSTKMPLTTPRNRLQTIVQMPHAMAPVSRVSGEARGGALTGGGGGESEKVGRRAEPALGEEEDSLLPVP